MPARHVGGLLAAGAALGAVATGSPALAMAVAGLGALAAGALVWPEIATLALVFCLWLNVPALAVDRFGAPQIAGALFPLVLLVPLVQARLHGSRMIVTRTFALLAVLLVVELVSTAFAADQHTAVERVKQFALEGPIVYLLVINVVRTPATLRRVLWALIAAGACLALVTLHQQLTGGYERPYLGLGQVDTAWFRGQSDVARLAGPLGDPNYYAQILVAILPLALLSVWRERSPPLRLAAAAAAGLLTAAIAFTYSRGAAVACVALLVVMVGLRYVRVRHLAAIALAIALLLAAVPAYRDRVASIASIGGATARPGVQTTADQSTRSRTTEMLAAGLAFLDHPVLGVGPGGFPAYYQRYAPRVGIEVRETTRSGPNAGERPEREAHDVILGMAADLGIAGLTAFVAILALTFRNLLRARRRWIGRRADLANLADSVLMALVAYLAAGLFLTLAFERYLWLLAALAGAAGGLALRAPR